jgi:hypothetical protein
MSDFSVQSALLAVLLVLTWPVSDSFGAQKPIALPDGRVVPGESCGMGVTTQSERMAILTRWIVAPTIAGAATLTTAVAIRRRLCHIGDPRRRAFSAAFMGILGAISLLLGLFVFLVSGLHLFDVFSLYEPIF